MTAGFKPDIKRHFNVVSGGEIDPAIRSARLQADQHDNNVNQAAVAGMDTGYIPRADQHGFDRFRELLQFTQKETKKRQDDFMRFIIIQTWQQAQEKAADMIKYYEGMAKIWGDMGNQAKKGEDKIELWAEHMRNKPRSEWLKRDDNGNLVDEQEAEFLEHLALVDPLFPKDKTDAELADYMQGIIYDTTQTHENTRKMIVVSEAMEKAFDKNADMIKQEVDKLNADQSLSEEQRKGKLAEFMEEHIPANIIQEVMEKAGVGDEYFKFAAEKALEQKNRTDELPVEVSMNGGFSP